MRRAPFVVAHALGRMRDSDRKPVHGLPPIPANMSGISCDQLVPQRKLWETKEKELKLLMDKAKQSTGGSAISVVAYQGDYVNAREELQVIDATARAKKCKMPDELAK